MRLSRERVDGIIRRHRPRGWYIKERPPTPTLWGHTDPFKRGIFVPPLVDREAIFILFHEIGHVRYRHDFYDTPSHVEEFEAEQYAIQCMRIEEIPVSRAQMKRARWNVGQCVKRDRKKGLGIRPEIARWAKS